LRGQGANITLVLKALERLHIAVSDLHFEIAADARLAESVTALIKLDAVETHFQAETHIARLVALLENSLLAVVAVLLQNGHDKFIALKVEHRPGIRRHRLPLWPLRLQSHMFCLGFSHVTLIIGGCLVFLTPLHVSDLSRVNLADVKRRRYAEEFQGLFF
jgi:hypothetical protein